MSVGAAYRACARVTRAQATNFYYAFLSLPRVQRRSVYALYAFCREADDCVDKIAESSDAISSTVEKRATDRAFLLDGQERSEWAGVALGGLRERLSQAAAANPSGLLTEKRGMDGAFLHDGSGAALRDVALADTIVRYGVRPSDLNDVIRGVEMDLAVSRYPTYDDLYQYCYCVASAVGLATLPILTRGRLPTAEMRARAIALGQGMQLVNILRDVAEDAARDRIYIPQEALRTYGVSAADIRGSRRTGPMRELLSSVAARARGQLAEGRRLIENVPRRSRGCLWLLAEIYGRILTEIEARDFDVFSSQVSLSKREKLLLLASTFWRRG